MISVYEAIEKIKGTIKELNPIEVVLTEANGCCLAEDIFAPIDMPPFDQSAMDGYAVCGGHSDYVIKSELKAGDSTDDLTLLDGEASRIFTGSMVPAGTRSVVPQEVVDVDGTIIRPRGLIRDSANIRRQGEEISKGDLVLRKGSKLNVAAIGFLSGLGIKCVQVICKPKIELIVTGNELIQPGNQLEPGKIYESNASTLSTFIRSLGLDCKVSFVKDDFVSTKSCMDQAIKKNDLIIATGGISVGDYDFVGKALDELEVREVFYKVNQKPGKPLYYGCKNDKHIFALPGNPAAALTCFLMYVLPGIRRLMGHSDSYLEKCKAEMSTTFVKKGNRAQFLKAKIKEGVVEINPKQNSSMLSSFIDANCLAFIPEDRTEVQAGSEVDVYLIPDRL